MTDITREQRLELLAQEIEFIELEIKRLNRQRWKHEEEARAINIELNREAFTKLTADIIEDDS
jgi:chaperonin cofactor prefoldin